jgi:hypothetical protein
VKRNESDEHRNGPADNGSTKPPNCPVQGNPRKYELLEQDTIELDGTTLYRIRAVADVGSFVKPGDLGGFVASEANLSHIDDAWVFGNARVSGKARVSGNAKVSGSARVSGNVWVSDDAWVFGNARMSGNARVSDYARLFGNAPGEVKVR